VSLFLQNEENLGGVGGVEGVEGEATVQTTQPNLPINRTGSSSEGSGFAVGIQTVQGS
jgi:hypothetical protein